ncbi:hypothetical protein ACFFGT_21505 [Mucilaginibacter angelicae]|uniref:Uncharacterized protein n=1 Tax=Mucilaginibacter angelicae TaxID=869718 RepID=A0ABV6LBI0_9SPHI
MKILTLTPHKPISYAPGLISLVLLPVFCMLFLYQHKVFTPRNCIDVVMFDPSWPQLYPSKYQFKFPPERSYINVNLTGNTGSDKSLLDFARLEIRGMLKAKNTTLGVRFHFGNKSQYWTFVNALDICYTEKALSWIAYQDNIYVLYVKPRY